MSAPTPGRTLVQAWVDETVRERPRYKGWYGLMPSEDEDDLVRRIDEALAAGATTGDSSAVQVPAAGDRATLEDRRADREILDAAQWLELGNPPLSKEAWERIGLTYGFLEGSR